MGFSELKGWLRHRHPMVLLDRVLDYEPGNFVSARLCVSGGLDTLAGHFPERSILPASHLIQAASQAAIILLQVSSTPLAGHELTLVTSCNARFFRLVFPGDCVEVRVELDGNRNQLFSFSAKAMVDQVRVAAFRLGVARVDVATLGVTHW